jgi:beta-glucosidase
VLKGKARLTVSVDVANTGAYAGKETVELFTRDLYASLTPPLKRLRAFKKEYLKPGEKKTVSFDLSADDFAFVNAASKLVTEPGEFEISVADLKSKFRYENERPGNR